jgi:two-component system, chemotaxis family, chemotaxis protein CheY
MALVLVIEDDAGLRRLLRWQLEKGGHRVVEAPDGRAGIAEYKRERPDLVVCDLFMPEIDGLGVIQELRRFDPGARIVAVSGGGAKIRGDFLEIARILGAVDTLAKPFGREDLLEAVGKALAS